MSVGEAVSGRPRADDNLGHAVAIIDNVVIAGAPGDDDHGTDSGAAYVFERAGDDSWSQLVKIVGSNAAARDFFGRAIVAIDDLVLVGADAHGVAGAVYVFRRTGDTWDEIEKIVPQGANSGAHFGGSLATDGETLIVGASLDGPRGIGSGSAFVFERQKGDTWIQTAKIFPSDGDPADRFGFAVAIDGGVVVAGAMNDDDRDDSAGAAYIFEQSEGGAWLQGAKLLASDGGRSDDFGEAVAVAGDTILVGASDHDDRIGSVYVFERVGSEGEWTETAELRGHDSAVGDKFGEHFAHRGSTLLVGARAHQDLTGAAYLFRRFADGWREVAKITSDDGEAEGQFGGALALTEDLAVVGATQETDDVEEAGAAYVFRLRPADINCDDMVGFADLLELLGSWGECPKPPDECRADLDGDGSVGFTDLLALLNDWG